MGSLSHHQSGHLRKGSSLLEVLLTLMLVSVALVVVASLATGAGRVARRGDRLSQTTRASHLLELVAFDVRRATSLGLSPGVEEGRLQMTVRRVEDPAFLPETPGPGWSVDAPNLQKTVTFRVDKGELIRQNDLADGSSTTDILGEAVEFFALLQPGGQVRLRLRLAEDEVSREVFPCTQASLVAPL